MNKTLLACGLGIAPPVLAQKVQVMTELNGLDIQVEHLGVPEADMSSQAAGVQAVTLANRGSQVASCQFHAEPEKTTMTAAPAVSIDPGEQAMLRMPGQYSTGGPFARLVGRPEGVPERQQIAPDT